MNGLNSLSFDFRRPATLYLIWLLSIPLSALLRPTLRHFVTQVQADNHSSSNQPYFHILAIEPGLHASRVRDFQPPSLAIPKNYAGYKGAGSDITAETDVGNDRYSLVQNQHGSIQYELQASNSLHH